VVDSIIDSFNNLLVPVLIVLDPVQHVVDVDSPVELFRSQPFQKHRVAILAGQVDNHWGSRRPDVGTFEQRLRTFTLVLGSVGFDPDLVLRVRF
jgi:hypothetical protein